MTPKVAAFALAVLFATGCSGGGSGGSPITPTTDAEPTTTEHWTNTLAVGGARFYSYTVSVKGKVNVTLNSIGGTGVDPSTQVGLQVGAPSGTGCAVQSPTATSAGTDPQLKLTGQTAGVYCLQISDLGNLPGPATFDIAIAHP